ncbi:MAG: hypothetical protein AB8G15_07050 [Saprospiraceae bacterium]
MKHKYDFDEDGRKVLGYAVFGFVLLALAFRWYSSVLLHQLQAPVLFFPYIDLTYWLVFWTGIPNFLVQNNVAALVFDLGLIGTAALSFCFVRRRIFPILFSLLFGIYFICYNAYGGHHTHSMAGILLMSLSFWFASNKDFSFVWEGLRYFTLFVYVDAFLWKLLRGSWWKIEQGVAVVMEDQMGNILFAPDSLYSQLNRFFLTHPMLLDSLYFIAILMEGVMIIGFFTKKYDWLCFILPFLFHTGTYFLVDVLFYELWVLTLVFLPWPSIMAYLKQRRSTQKFA